MKKHVTFMVLSALFVFGMPWMHRLVFENLMLASPMDSGLAHGLAFFLPIAGAGMAALLVFL